jgi:lysine-specific demethylase 3
LCKQVNILTHTDVIKLKAKRIKAIEKKKRSLTIKEDNRNQASRTDPDCDMSKSIKVPRAEGFGCGSNTKQSLSDVVLDEREGVHKDVVADEGEGNLTVNVRSSIEGDVDHIDLSISKEKAEGIVNESEKVHHGASSEDKSESPDNTEGTSEPTGCRNRRRDAHCSSSASTKEKETHTEDEVHEIPISLEGKEDRVPFVEGNQPEGGALWDIFRREDVSKLQEYLMKHSGEFRHYNYEPVKQVISSVNYLTLECRMSSYSHVV